MMSSRVFLSFIVIISASCTCSTGVAVGSPGARRSKYDLALSTYNIENANDSVWPTDENDRVNSGASGNPQGHSRHQLVKYQPDDWYAGAMLPTNGNTAPGDYNEQPDDHRQSGAYNPSNNGQRVSYNEPINRQPQDYYQGSFQPGPFNGQPKAYNYQPEPFYKQLYDYHLGRNGQPGFFVVSYQPTNLPTYRPTTKNGRKSVDPYLINSCPNCQPAAGSIYFGTVTSGDKSVYVNAIQHTGSPSTIVSQFANSYPKPVPGSTNYYGTSIIQDHVDYH